MERLSTQTSPCDTPYGTPLFSRASSFSSFASCFSRLDHSLVDTDSEDELLDTGQLHPDIFVSDEFMEKGKGNLVKEEDCQPSHTAVFSDGANNPIAADQNILSGQPQLETDQGATKERIDASNVILDTSVSKDPDRDILSNDQLTGMQYGESLEDNDLEQPNVIYVEEVTSLPMPGGEIIPLNEQVMDQRDSTKENTIVYNNILNTESDMKSDGNFESGIDYLYPLVSPSFDTDPLIWLPPEPANKEDDVDTLANHEDDSDNNDTGWGKSSLNPSFDEERSKNSREDQLHKAMSEVMNGQFKILVSRFLAAEGFSLSDGGTDNAWLDIVASLSWHAALLVKPDDNVGNSMDPGLYVKVKCIASGSCQQSEVINGLVFKKSAAHKQMRANIKHPKLLILQGAIGNFSTGLSSINSMKQESEQLEKTLSDVIVLYLQKHNCLSCVEPPEAHMYSYTHRDGTLTVLVRSLPLGAALSGQDQGRIWMWTRCLRCSGKPTNRVIISSSARNLSFGKFLELSFSTHSSAKKLSTCGHLLHRDCLRFFGLGSKVAMFRYSSVEIYSACKPAMALQFHDPNKKEWLDVEVKNVLLKWKLLFSEIENIIQGLKSRYSGEAMGENRNSSACEGLFLEVSGMLAQEKDEFEVSLNAFDHIAKPEACAYDILSLNWLYQQLLLGFYIWDIRLGHLLQYSKINAASSDNSTHKSKAENELRSSKTIAVHGDSLSVPNIAMERQEATINSSGDFENSCSGTISEKDKLTEKSIIKEQGSSPGVADENGSHQIDPSVQNVNHIFLDKSSVLPVKNDEHPAPARGDEIPPVAIPCKGLHVLRNLLDFASDDTGEWVWSKFSHLEREYKKEIQVGSLDKFHLINKYTPSSSSLTQLKYQMHLMHFTVGPCGNILSIVDEEVSSIIAYALAISEQQGIYSEAAFEKDELISRKKLDKVAPSNLARGISMPASVVSTNKSLEKDHSMLSNASSLTYEESASGFYDSFLSALKDMHPEICLNSEKLALKSKYTVVSIYARQFYELRKICCPSELAYISSISRCKIWNAQGGKSKAFFAKSMDDRFIIKEIKKTEFDSFLKFGLEYFKHFGVSRASSNPTCLAKILGIYQVKEIRNGKETRSNFMVMENLLFGRNILRRYDLKGALFSRYVADSKNPESVLLDQNFIEDMRTMPIYIEGKTKNLMERAIWNDTSFLCRMNVMDYSLFVGVDKQKKELVFGIIDYLRQYTWDKQLESWVKTSLVVPKNLSPTVISPKEYKLRFRIFMSQYFLSVPDA
ncbi:hypothetical protein ACQ4PT_063522 [Festuca glaucescens]